MSDEKLYVVGVDGSDCAKRAVEFAARLAGESGARLLLVHVINWSGYMPMNVMEVAERPLDKAEEERITKEDILAPAGKIAAGAGVAYDSWYSWGHPARLITKKAVDEGAEMIIMGRRGHGAIAELILGSVSNAVSHHSSLPVTLVP